MLQIPWVFCSFRRQGRKHGETAKQFWCPVTFERFSGSGAYSVLELSSPRSQSRRNIKAVLAFGSLGSLLTFFSSQILIVLAAARPKYIENIQDNISIWAQCRLVRQSPRASALPKNQTGLLFYCQQNTGRYYPPPPPPPGVVT